ncbi:MAG: flagellar motor switch protein FliG [Pseudomonadota bacterium]
MSMIDEHGAPSMADAMAEERVAAILLMLVAEDEAADLLARLEPAEVRQLGHAVYGLTDATERDVHRAIDLFVARAQGTSMLAHGATARLGGAMHRALGPARAQAILADVAPTPPGDRLAALKWLAVPDIAAMLAGEHPQLCALVIAHLAPEVAAEVIQKLPEEEQDDVLFRVATLGPVSADAVAAVAALVAQAQPAADAAPALTLGGTGEAAAILNNVRKADEKRIMRALARRDRDVARMIEQDMFTFADLATLDDRNLGTLLRSVDSVLLVPALKGAEAGLRTRMLACMSARAAQTIEDEIAERGPMPVAEVQEAQRGVIVVARRLADEGTLTIGGKGEEYV